MQTLNLLICLDIQATVFDDDERLEDLTKDVLLPIIQRLRQSSQLKCGIHLSARLMHWLVRRQPERWAELQQLVKTRRLELFGGGFYDPILAAIPEHDAAGQLQLTANFFREQFGESPAGAWLVGRAWDPALPGLFSRAGISYTLVDEKNFLAARLERDELDGYYMAERDGFALAVFPILAQLQRKLPEGDRAGIVQQFRQFMDRHQERKALLAFDDLATREDAQRIVDLMDACQQENHWIKMRTCAEMMDRDDPVSRVYLPSITHPFGLDDTLQGLGWTRFLVQYPEINNLHKRMLMTSYRVQRMRGGVREAARRGQNPKEQESRRARLERACTQLWQAQTNVAYWHGEQLGCYDPWIRHQTSGNLLTAGRLANQVLDQAHDGPIVRSLDLDCDGNPELVVKTKPIGAVISPSRGGCLTALDLSERDLALGEVIRRYEEPCHLAVTDTDLQLVHGDRTMDMSGMPVIPAEQATRLGFDATGRHSFVDYLLDANTTLQSWCKGCFRDSGGFAGHPYQVMTHKKKLGENEHGVLLGRNGTIEEAGRSSLVRIEKSYIFSTAHPRLRASYRLINRYFEPARVWFGTEFNLALPGGPSARYDAVCSTGDVSGAIDHPIELQHVGYLELLDEEADLVICFYMDDPMDLWLTPIETVHRFGDQYHHIHQGVSLLLHDNRDLWGTEEQRIEFKIEFLNL